MASHLQLSYAGMKIASVEIQFQNKIDGTVKNTLQTFRQETDVELSRGLDFSPKGAVYARLTHLQHHPFSYKIKVQNEAMVAKKGTFRIFLAPKCDERDRILTFEEQRHLMIEMDRFVADSKEFSIHVWPFMNYYEQIMNTLCSWRWAEPHRSPLRGIIGDRYLR